MGNCLKGCLSDDTNGGRTGRTRLNASDSHYEILLEGMQGTGGRQEEEADSHEAIQIKSNGKWNIFRKFWTRTKPVDYARLNKAKHNNFSQRPSTGPNQSKHNQHPTSGFDIQLQCLDAHSLLLVSKDGHRKATAGYNDLQTDQTSTPGSSLDLEWENDYGYQHGQWLTQEEDPMGMPSHLGSFPASVQESVFKIDEWSTLKRSKDRINALRKRDPLIHQPPATALSQARLRASTDELAGSLESIRGTAGDLLGHRRFPPAVASLSSVDRIAHGGSSDLSHISTTPEGSLEWDVDQDRQLKSENESLDYDTKELLLEIEQLKNRVLSETGATLKVTDEPTLS
ncbi:uncharacterized protein LOC131293000 [Anopheles ziemanni]|uniref:uncharacterized protein LOC131261909 n=1 Tax=Anopheles coustani TaxID=139045 RepID=UPI002658A0BE|nr:uncharacterized protein LOC131261909 [Anopheles coustani]XP_058177063.1 uncharacterized protein LOC131293000 [Anopheles ziemanni]